ncbi:MAG: serine hydrolase domain-containing protein [Erythrobacter sp.]
MIRCILAALALLATPLAARETPPPASVVVAFDREGVRPLIVEGLANKDSGRAVAANDPVRIASVSKLIMALAALRLADEGKLDFQRDVSDYLGWPLRSPYHPQAPVTLIDLLMHRAGLSDAAGYIIPLGESLEAKLAEPAAWRDTGPPGEAAFEYANLGSPLVATVLEAASGERYDALLERLVFAPLGITACVNWTRCDKATKARAVTLYRHSGEVARDDPADLECPIPVAEGVACNLDSYVPGTNASVFSPQGGVRIGMRDLARIGQEMMQFLNGSDFLSAEAQALWIGAMMAAFERQVPGEPVPFCGYGLALYQLGGEEPCTDDLFMDGAVRWGHGGEAYGLRSGLWFDRARGTGFAYFTTEVPPPSGEVETASADPRERALMARAQSLLKP